MARIESRHQSILEAMIRVAGQEGYRGATVGDTIVEAGVSRTTFYKHFDDKEACFLAAYDFAAERVLAAVAAGCADRERPWTQRARLGLESLVDLLAGNPELARIVVVEATMAGAGGRARQWSAIARGALLLEACREGRGEVSLPANTGLMAVCAVGGLLFDEIQAGRTEDLPRHLPELLFALLVPYLGPRQAAEEMRRADTYPATSR
jgi:AcrR family transcriptional regulator